MLLPRTNALNSFFGENLFDDFFEDFARPMRAAQRYNTSVGIMRTDVKETEAGYELDIVFRRRQEEKVTAELKEGYLTISAETNRSDEQKDENGRYLRRERYYGNCSRSFYVGEDITQEDIRAKFEDGILKVAIPKKEVKPAVEESKYIQIEG